MANKKDTFSMSKTLLAELKNEATYKHQTLAEYLDDFLEAILFVNWSKV